MVVVAVVAVVDVVAVAFGSGFGSFVVVGILRGRVTTIGGALLRCSDRFCRMERVIVTQRCFSKKCV